MNHPIALPATTAEPSLPAPADLDALARKAAAFARATSADSTRKAYARDWIDFAHWCRSMHLTPMPAAPATVGTYLTALAERLAVATLTRRLAAISTRHRLAGHRLDTKHPAIRDCVRGIRRSLGTAQRRVEPATTGIVQAMAGSCDTSLLGLRDRALLLLGFAAALRRGEIVALDVGDIAVVAEGLRLTIRHSKTDQDGAGEVVGIVRTGSASCPVAALQAWLAASGISEGRVFRAVDRHSKLGATLTDQSVALIIKRRAAAVGLDPENFAGHSLCAGLATAAASRGVEERIIMRQTRHVGVTVRRYIRDGEVFLGNASGRVGL